MPNQTTDSCNTAIDVKIANYGKPERLFDVLPVALPLARGDDAWRLAVDRGLSAVQRSAAGQALYIRYFGPPSEQNQLLMKLFQRSE